MLRRVVRWAALPALGVLTVAACALAVAGEPGWALAPLALVAGIGAGAAVATDLRVRSNQRLMNSVLASLRDVRRTQSRLLESQGRTRATLRDRGGRQADERIALMERRFLASFEAERLRAGDRHREVMTEARELGAATRSLESTTAGLLRNVATELTATMRDETREVEALLQLLPTIRARALLPPSGRWAMDARSLGHLRDVVATARPERVLELGSGTSTIWLGYLLEGSGATIVSLDHDVTFAERTRAEVRRHGFDGVIDVRHAPLVATDHGHGSPWYDVRVVHDLERIDLLLVDGPPGSVGPRARAAALPALHARLSQDALVILDDSEREDERSIVAEWLSAFPDFHRYEQGISRLAVLRRSR